MKLFQRILCTCLVLLLLTAAAAGCGETPDDPSESGSDTLTVTEGETVDEAAQALEAIDEVDYGGREFTVLYAEGTNFEEELIGMPDMADAVASGVINDAVFERNTEFELRCKLTYVKVPANNMSMLGMLTNEIAAGDTVEIVRIFKEKGYTVSNIDATVIAQKPKMASLCSAR